MSPDQAWDLIWSIVAGAIALALVTVFAVPIANVIRSKLYERRMRRHFSDTRHRRRPQSGRPR